MSSDIFLSKEKIDRLYKMVVDLPDYMTASQTQSGAKTPVGKKLDHLVNAANNTMLLLGDAHLAERFRQNHDLANQILFHTLNPLQHRLHEICDDASTQLPLISDAQQIFAQAYAVFNPDDSYGRYAQSVLQHAADALELGILSEIVVKQGLSK